MKRVALVTGSLGLVGFSVTKLFLAKGWSVIGVDNNMRAVFFGANGSTAQTLDNLDKEKSYLHKNIDIRNYRKLEGIFSENKISAVIHTAAQPSHDKAKDIPILDFEVNALGTLNLLQLTRLFAPKAVFVYTSTNKVYGDNPNKIKFREANMRYVFKDKGFLGFDENTSIDNCLHSLFGVSKAAADLYVQEYGRYFGLATVSLRLGCITGANHSGVKLHGFLSYLVKSLINDNSYQIIGYKGKQVRDQIHADDLAEAIMCIVKKPSGGEVFNMGGGMDNSASVLELIEMISGKIQGKPRVSYDPSPRVGDHICYITDYSKFRRHYPDWRIKRGLESIVDEIIASEQEKIQHS